MNSPRIGILVIRGTAEQMLRQAMLRPVKQMAMVAPMSEIWPGRQGTLLFGALYHFQHIALILFRGLFAYQWVLVARRNERIDPHE